MSAFRPTVNLRFVERQVEIQTRHHNVMQTQSRRILQQMWETAHATEWRDVQLEQEE